MNWWNERPIRFVQTNLREIDLPLDPREYARCVQEYHADAVLFNLGGIVANYPTRLDFHYANPRVRQDFISELIAELHRNDIRFMGRFDFSKVNESIGRQHPEWLYQGLDGAPALYNGQMQCCVNGDYQQNCSLEILKEALGLYPLDGVFFNMVGYQTTDYSGVYHGICQCANCRRRFGAELPREEDGQDEAYRTYLRFCQETSRELFHRMRETIRAARPDCAINTYTHEGVDMIRSESNSGLRRPQPEFVYESSLNVRRVYASWPGLVSSNAVVHFIDFPYRHAGVAPALTARRLAQNLIHGGWVDFYVIGRLDEQQDRACLPAVREIYRLSQRADGWLSGAKRLADVCLVAVDRAAPGYQAEELKGLVTLLSEEHLLYDVVEQEALEAGDPAARLAQYKLVVLPDMAYIPPRLAEALEKYVARGGRLLLTGACGSLDAGGGELSRAALGCAGWERQELRPQTRGAYFGQNPGDAAALPELGEVDWLPLDTSWLAVAPQPGTEVYLHYIPVGMFGPPEKCYYVEQGSEPGLLVKRSGKGVCASLLWQIGAQQQRFPTHAIPRLFKAVVDSLLQVPRLLRVEAPPLVEISAFESADGNSLVVGMVNLSGQNGRLVHDPLPIEGVRVTLAKGAAVGAASLAQGDLALEGDRTVRLARLGLCDLLRIDRRLA